MSAKKPKIGVYSFSSCSGCQIAILNLEDILADLLSKFQIKFFHLIQGENKEEPVDILFVEGAITTTEHVEKIKELRKKAGTLVAIGACACTGGIPAMKNEVERQKIVREIYGDDGHVDAIPAQGIDRFVDVDYHIRGCPITKEEFAENVLAILAGERPYQRPYPVCTECRLRDNGCFLDKGEVCLGAIAHMGCGAPCPTNNTPCVACRGLCEDPRIAALITLMKEKKIPKETIRKAFDQYLKDRVDMEEVEGCLK